jgi:hypothetical protein
MKPVRLTRDGQLIEVTLVPEHFSIDPTNIDWDLCNLGRYMLEYVYLEVELRTEVAGKEAELERHTAALDTTIRLKAKTLGEKTTEAKVKNEVISDPGYQQQLDSLRVSKENWNIMRHALNILHKKHDLLTCLAYRDKQLLKADGH